MWAYDVIRKGQWTFWTKDARFARIGTWWLRDLLFELLKIDIWQPDKLGLMFFVHWLLQIPYAMFGMVFSFNVPLVIFVLIFNSLYVDDHWNGLISGEWSDLDNFDEYLMVKRCNFPRYFTQGT